MRKVLPIGNGRLILKLLAVTAVGALMAGCSTDSTRLGDPLGNPFSTSANDAAPQRHVADAMPAGRTPPVRSQALAAPSRVAAVEPLRPNLTRSAAQRVSRETTGSIDESRARTAQNSSFGGWTSAGGVPVTVGEGESADLLAKRYGVPATALLQTNGYSSPSDVRPGMNLTIPVYNAVAAAHTQPVAAPSTARAALTRPVAERSAAAAQRKLAVASKPEKVEKAEKVARAEPPHALKAPTAEKVAATAPVEKVAPRKVAPAAAPAKVAVAVPAAKAPVAAPVTKVAAATPVSVPAKAAPGKLPAVPAAAPEPKVAAAAPVESSTAPQAQVADAGKPEFRWPARGRIIQGFKGGNDGINIALPEGTSIKAAEGGTVAYAGSELKGYGNLVLIRHPNGYVTAYANNGELDVKRGDQVKRGQTIAKSGQSGNVSSPQLHFELRKGSTPVDPVTFLAGL